MNTSIDSLAPDSPILPVMLAAKRPPWVQYHNIVGHVADPGLLERVTGVSDGDGVVSTQSAHFEGAESEVVVNSEHSEIHRHPLSVLEVYRILDCAPGRSRQATAEPSGASALHGLDLWPVARAHSAWRLG